MSVKIKYAFIPAETGKKTQREEEWEQEFENIVSEAEKELKEHAGFLKLTYRETGETLYYNCNIHGILGNLSSPASFGIRTTMNLAREILKREGKKSYLVDKEKLPAEILKQEEYETLFSREEYKKQQKLRGWQEIRELKVMTAEGEILPPVSADTDAGEIKYVYLIPVFRCEENGWEMPPDFDRYSRTAMFIRHGLFPDFCFSGTEDAAEKDFAGLLLYLEKYYAKNADKKGVKPTVVKAGGAELEEIKKYYREMDYRAAGLPRHDNTIFQQSEGSWDLYPFAGLDEADLDRKDGIWYETDGIYAGNPLEHVAPETEQAAIDFGTKSTTVAVLDKKGNITMIPTGDMNGSGDYAFENPTILKFQDIRQFMEDYRRSEFRPDTKYSHICASYQAFADYECFQDNQMHKYFHHLKQWADCPNGTWKAVDSHGEEILLERSGHESAEETMNPIEIYAYYIGRSINNMHHGKIYLKYLLSYTPTYMEEDREWIRRGFERGLKKSLPPEVGNNKELMKGFEVKLWRDEATAYAVSALNRYVEEDYRMNGEAGFYMRELAAGGIFYGIYDFGGGTLDFTFGMMSQKGEKDVFWQLKRGGSPNLGCENLLEELAYEIFCREENRNRLAKKKIKCEKPFLYGTQQNEYQIVSRSSAARYNTDRLITYLRTFWITGRLEENFWLRDEDGNDYEGELKPDLSGQEDNAGRIIRLKQSKEELESFFCEKVTMGIRLFIQYYKEVLKEQKKLEQKKLFLFLAGNASRAERVKACFDRELEQEGLTGDVCIQLPLPTASDEKEYKKHPGKSIPTAKSGVVFGLLLSRPGAADIRIVDKIPGARFRYHIGIQKKDRGNANRGLFQLLLPAARVPSEGNGYLRLLQIPQPVFEILYTSDGAYALQDVYRVIDDGVSRMVIRVPKEYTGYGLYVRAKAGSPEILELGAAESNEKYLHETEKIGVCDFGKIKFESWSEKSEPSEKTDIKQEHAVSDPVLCIKDQETIRFHQPVLTEDEIRPRPLFKTESEELEILLEAEGRTLLSEKLYFGKMNASKDIRLLKKKGNRKVAVACNGRIWYEIDTETGVLHRRKTNG